MARICYHPEGITICDTLKTNVIVSHKIVLTSEGNFMNQICGICSHKGYLTAFY